MLLTPVLQAVTDNPFPASYSDKVRQVGLLSRKNKLITDVLAKALDSHAGLRKYLIEKYVMEGVTLQKVMTDDDACEASDRVARGASELNFPIHALSLRYFDPSETLSAS